MSETSRALGTLGMVAILVMWSVPLYDVYIAKTSVFRLGSTEQLATAFNYIAGLFNCVLWVMYTANQQDTLYEAFLTSVLGIALNFLLVACYWYYSQNKQRQDANVQVGVLLGVVVLMGIIMLIVEDNEFVGYVAIVLDLLMYFGPLMALPVVCKTRSVSGMPLPPLLMVIITSSLWTAYAAVLNNLPLLISNVGGMVFGAIQLVTWFYVYFLLQPPSGYVLVDQQEQPV